jgi:polyphosphate kinase
MPASSSVNAEPERVPQRSRRGRRVRYLNRELSWIEFNARVLHEARDERNPLLDRVRFLSIFASNLDEFFQVRVSGLRQQVLAGVTAIHAEGPGPAAQLRAVRSRVLELVAEHSAIFRTLRGELRRAGIELVD